MGLAWNVWETDIIEIIEDWYILSFAYRWADENNITVKALPDYPGYKKNIKNDRALVKNLHKLLSSCDIAIAHNGDAFDFKKAFSRFLYYKLKPVPPFRQIDTLKILRKRFKLDSNRLDAACAFLGIGRKLPHTGKHMWLGCMNADRKSWAKMRRYNAHDVTLLYLLFEYLRGWATNLPNLNLYTGGKGCPSCGSSQIVKHGRMYSRSVVRQRYSCKECGAWHAGERIKLSN